MNVAILLGRMTSDVELRFLAGSGMAVSNFILAVDKGLSKDKKAEFDSQGKQTADFIRCKAFGKRAETIANHFRKGSQILVQGSINTGSYKREDGSTAYTTDINVTNFNFTANSKKDDLSTENVYVSDFQSIEDDNDIPF